MHVKDGVRDLDHSHDIWNKLSKDDRIKNVRQCVEFGICHENLADQYRNRTYGTLKREALYKEMRIKQELEVKKKKKAEPASGGGGAEGGSSDGCGGKGKHKHIVVKGK